MEEKIYRVYCNGEQISARTTKESADTVVKKINARFPYNRHVCMTAEFEPDKETIILITGKMPPCREGRGKCKHAKPAELAAYEIAAISRTAKKGVTANRCEAMSRVFSGYRPACTREFWKRMKTAKEGDLL